MTSPSISQPAISNWIAKMEADCGEKLFYRTNRGVSLTPKGEEMYARLDIVYNRFRVSVAEICGDPSTQNAALRIGCLNRQQPVQVANQIVLAWQKGRMTPAMERFLSLLDEMEGTAALPRA